MTTFIAEIVIMPHKELLDPQGRAVNKNLKSINVDGVLDVRIGKHIQLKVEASDKAAAEQKVEMACKNMLANVIMESYQYTISPLA